jgi:enoyl-CoA hydratase/carnithine racemase
MDYEFLIFDRPADGIARITLNRPEVLNAIHLPLWDEIRRASQDAADDDDVAVLIYRGAGRAFCVGRDMKYAAKLQAEDPEGWLAWRRRYRGFGPQTWTHPKATIAQVQGHALGGGHDLAISSDITVVAQGAQLGYPEARYGLLMGGRHVWNWLAGPKKTKEYVFTGRTITGEEAVTWGLANQVVAPDDLDDTVMAIANDIVAIERRNPGYVRVNKFQINQQHLQLMNLTTFNPGVLEQIPNETQFLLDARRSQERFYDKVGSEGLHAATGDMHAGFASAPARDAGAHGDGRDA